MTAAREPIPRTISGDRVSDILYSRARSGGMEGADGWSDDWRILAARDRASRLLRYHCGWPNESFLPSDAFNAIAVHLEYEPLDLAALVLDLEELFGFEIPSDEKWGVEYTYLDFLLVALAEGRADFEAWDAEAFRPFVLRPDYHSSWWARHRPRFGPNSAKGTVAEFYGRQGRRTEKWREYWPDDAALLAVRDGVSAIIVGESGWFDDAFIPDDRLDALLSGVRSRRLHRVAEGIRAAFPGAGIDAGGLSKNPISYGLFVERLAAANRRHGDAR